jgi:hydroxyethylthiazole kinase-like uncharacterized protein yjeF
MGGLFMNELEGVLAHFLSSAQMRAIEQAAIRSGNVSGFDLMDRAGREAARIIDGRFQSASGAVVLCGPGNNGGDGYVIARCLRDGGWPVKLFALADPATPDAQAARAAWTGTVGGFDALDWSDLSDAPVVVDAIFGTGLMRDVAPCVWGALAMAQEAGCPVVAVDILSGVCADSGRVRSAGGYVDHPAALTVTFAHAKLGHVLAEGGELAGTVEIADIGLEDWSETLMRQDDLGFVLEATPSPQVGKLGGHKYDHGHALVLAGDMDRAGAARLAARAALRVGAGLVTLGCPTGALGAATGRVDALMPRPVADGAALRDVLSDRRIGALVAGPGLGLGAREVGLVEAALASRRASVLDADALTLVGGDAGLRAGLHERCVLTPHEGEFARLFPEISAWRKAEPTPGSPAVSKVDAARRAAREAGCVVLLKGADTVIAGPDGRCAVHAAVRGRAAPWLATAGAGDVLAGLIGGLLARGLSPFEAAETAAWLHVQAALAFGPGLIADDLPDMLPAVFRAMGL